MPSLYMQVCAHEDDDLLFMNPDIAASIAAGDSSVTVYMTAGNITGTGSTDEERTRNRQRGIQDAYARMAGITSIAPNQADWQGELLMLAGKGVEHYWLPSGPDVHLVFLNTHDGQLSDVYSGPGNSTVVPLNGMATTSYPYVHADAVNVLTALLNKFNPTVLRFQDLNPDPRYGHTTPEHPDHHAAMLFITEVATATGSTAIQLSYRDYEISVSPVDLPSDAVTDKTATVSLYAAYDDTYNPLNWVPRMYHRYARGTTWAGNNEDGRIQIFVVRGGKVYTHWQTAGGWASPILLGNPGGPVAPTIAVGNNGDARLEIFARRLSDHHIVTVFQTEANGGWSSWVDLGSPNAGLSNADQIGVPAVASNADGRMQIFVKNGGGGLSSKFQTSVNGTWSGWIDMGGTDVQDGVAAILNANGQVEVFGATTTGVLRWVQATPNGTWNSVTTTVMTAPACLPQVGRSANNRVQVAYRHDTTGEIVVYGQSAVGGSFGSTPTVLSGRVGLGEPAIFSPDGSQAKLAVVGRNVNGTLSVCTQSTPNGAYDDWVDLDGQAVDFATVLDAQGRINLFRIGSDGLIGWTRQTDPGSDDYEAWQTLPA